jgi:A/G-specific adenine glycosylase
MKGFSEKIIDWYRFNARDLPWRKTKDPYKIWLSEIILQQTRVEQGTPYYLKFIRLFPTLSSLAQAEEKTVLKAWEGLGYYSRARNLLCAAKEMFLAYGDSGFPDSHEKLIRYKGIGNYTAAAVSSIAFGESRAVVDGNVYRVLARVFGINEAIDSSFGKKIFQKLADELVPKKNAGDYNQGLMEFGAMICTPKSPKCDGCIFQNICFACRKNLTNSLPVKNKKIAKKKRHLIYFDVVVGNKRLIKKREFKKDIWEGLYEFPSCELEKKPNAKMNIGRYFYILFPSKETGSASIEKPKYFKHTLTHQELHVYFVRVVAKNIKESLKKEYIFVSEKKTRGYPFPKLFEKYFDSI